MVPWKSGTLPKGEIKLTFGGVEGLQTPASEALAGRWRSYRISEQ